MKAQINSLINGAKNVIRKTDDAKYINAPKATSHVGYGGTNRDIRAEIAEKVFAENGETMTILLEGIKIEMKRYTTTTGKTSSYSADIPEEIAQKYVNTDGNERSYEVLMHSDCTMTINKYVRKNERCNWRHSMWQDIDESFVEIL